MNQKTLFLLYRVGLTFVRTWYLQPVHWGPPAGCFAQKDLDYCIIPAIVVNNDSSSNIFSFMTHWKTLASKNGELTTLLHDHKCVFQTLFEYLGRHSILTAINSTAVLLEKSIESFKAKASTTQGRIWSDATRSGTIWGPAPCRQSFSVKLWRWKIKLDTTLRRGSASRKRSMEKPSCYRQAVQKWSYLMTFQYERIFWLRSYILSFSH